MSTVNTGERFRSQNARERRLISMSMLKHVRLKWSCFLYYSLFYADS